MQRNNLITSLDNGNMLVVWNEDFGPGETVIVEDYHISGAIVSADSGDLLGVVRIDRADDKPVELLGALIGFREVLEAALVG